ncbi:MAG: BamA/TamA family outer membrane protein, partial [Myxococcota bacterium]|nr:BamA/TamA family outer membrane protein [Myxococcota bacterium]
SVGLPLSLGGWSTSSSATYSFTQQDPVLNVDPNHDPLDPPPTAPRRIRSASVAMSLSLGATESFYDSISTEKGWLASAGLRLRRPELGGDDEAVELTYSGRTYFDVWARHVFALKVNGAIGRGGDGRRAFYALAPPPERPVLLDAFDGIYFGTNFLRGFPTGTVSGDRFLLLSAEYRIPIWDVFKGIDAVPVFLRRFKLSVFTDWAQAGNSPLTWTEERFARSVGAEFVSQATLGWRLPLNIRLGYAHGFKAAGETQVYFFLGNWF